MKYLKKKPVEFCLSLICCLFFYIGLLKAQQFRYDHLTIDNGLSQNTVQSIIQDKYGYMWFGTQDGLNRFDGYNFKIFRTNRSDTNSISDNFITTIFEDSNNNLWIGTNSGGLNFYNWDDQSFTRYMHTPSDTHSISNNNIWAISEDIYGNLLIATGGGGLSLFNKKTKTFTNYLKNPGKKNSLNDNHIRSILVTKNNQIWLGSESKGISKIIYKKNSQIQFKPFLQNSKLAKDIKSSSITGLLEIKPGILIIGTASKGLIIYNTINNKFTKYRHIQNDPYSLSGNGINTLYQDKEGSIWIGTHNSGLNKFDFETKKFKRFSHRILDKNNLSSNQIMSVYQDNSGLMWIGTRDRGINIFKPNEYKFIHYKNVPDDPNSLGFNTIRSIYSKDPDVVWIGTFGRGLDKFIRKENRFEHIDPDTSKKYTLNNNFVSTIFIDDKDRLWLGTWGGGLNKMISSKSFISYKHSPQTKNSICDNRIQAILEDEYGNLWIGTENGLSYFNPEKETFINYYHDPTNNNSISDNRIQSNCIQKDDLNNLWIGTWNGLNKIELHENGYEFKKVHKYYYDRNTANSLSDNRIISMLIDSYDYEKDQIVIWVGTYSGGLNKLIINYPRDHKRRREYFISYNISDGLANNIVYGILQDNNGYLWLSTNNGLSRFNTKSSYGDLFTNYNVYDGLQSNQFFWGSYHKNQRGELFFGGINGLNLFHPDSIGINSYVPPIVITKFKKNNQEILFKSDLQELDKIKLKYTDNFFSFVFSALDYTMITKNQFAYKMEGFDSDWISAGNKNEAVYMNLDPGYYIFHVKGSNNDGIWNEKGTSIDIYIEPPFWKTWWFQFLTLIFVIMVLFSFYKYRTLRIKKQNIILQKEIDERKRTETELNKAQNYINNILNSMPSVVIGVNEDCEVTHWNEEAEKITNVNKEKATGKNLEDVFPSMANEIENIKKSIASRSIIKDSKIKDISDNQNQYSDLTVYPLISNGVEGAVIRIDDVTERVRLEEMMIQSEKMLSVGGLAAGMAHEINNPLAGMLQNAQVILNRLTQKMKKNDEVANECNTTFEAIQSFMEKRKIIEMLQAINITGKRASKIVENMLSFSRKSESRFSSHDIRKVLDDTIELAASDYDLKKKFDFRKIKMVKEYDDNVLLVNCERSNIQQVFLNVLRNGAQAMMDAENKEKDPCFTFRVKQDKDMVRIEIEDNGFGMEEEIRRRAFEPFYTTKEVNTGTGLGLSVSYFIITEQHNGKMSIVSNPNKGTNVIIHL